MSIKCDLHSIYYQIELSARHCDVSSVDLTLKWETIVLAIISLWIPSKVPYSVNVSGK